MDAKFVGSFHFAPVSPADKNDTREHVTPPLQNDASQRVYSANFSYVCGTWSNQSVIRYQFTKKKKKLKMSGRYANFNLAPKKTGCDVFFSFFFASNATQRSRCIALCKRKRCDVKYRTMSCVLMGVWRGAEKVVRALTNHSSPRSFDWILKVHKRV